MPSKTTNQFKFLLSDRSSWRTRALLPLTRITERLVVKKNNKFVVENALH